jgi:hypothetical protein
METFPADRRTLARALPSNKCRIVICPISFWHDQALLM